MLNLRVALRMWRARSRRRVSIRWCQLVVQPHVQVAFLRWRSQLLSARHRRSLEARASQDWDELFHLRSSGDVVGDDGEPFAVLTLEEDGEPSAVLTLEEDGEPSATLTLEEDGEPSAALMIEVKDELMLAAAGRDRETALRAALRQLKASREESQPAVPTFLRAALAALQPVELHRRPELGRRALRWARRRHLRCWALRARAFAAIEATLDAGCRAFWLGRLSRGWIRWLSRRDTSDAELVKRALRWATRRRMQCWALRARAFAAVLAADFASAAVLDAARRYFWLGGLSRGWSKWLELHRRSGKTGAELGRHALRLATRRQLRRWALRARAFEAVEAAIDAGQRSLRLGGLSRGWSKWMASLSEWRKSTRLACLGRTHDHRLAQGMSRWRALRLCRAAMSEGSRWATRRHLRCWALTALRFAAAEAALQAGRRSCWRRRLSRGWRRWLVLLADLRESTQLASLGRSHDHRLAQGTSRWRSYTSFHAAISEATCRAAEQLARRRMSATLVHLRTDAAACSTYLAMLDTAADMHAFDARCRALCAWRNSLATDSLSSVMPTPGLQQGLRRWTVYTAAITISHSGRLARHVLAMRSALRRMASQRKRGRRQLRRRCVPLPARAVIT